MNIPELIDELHKNQIAWTFILRNIPFTKGGGPKYKDRLINVCDKRRNELMETLKDYFK